MDGDQAVFNEELIAVQSGTVQVFNFDLASGEYVSAESIFIPTGVGLPAGSCTEPPPGCDVNQVAVRDDGNLSWSVIDDYRGVVVYDIQTLSPRIISELGPLPDTVTTSEPETPYDKWDGSAWVTDESAQHANEVETAVKQKAELIANASAEISILQDAVNLEMATESEKSRLLALQTYRVLLNRVDTSLAPAVTWPVSVISYEDTSSDGTASEEIPSDTILTGEESSADTEVNNG